MVFFLSHYRRSSQHTVNYSSNISPFVSFTNRYFPNCRYGASCHFAHPSLPPQPGYYAAPPPHPFPHYDPNAPVPYAPQFYPGHPSFPPPHQIISPPPTSQPDAGSPVQSPDGTQAFPPPPSGYMMAPYPPGVSPNGAPAPYMTPYPPHTPGAYPTYPYPPPSPTQQRNGEQQQQSMPVYYPPYPIPQSAHPLPTPPPSATTAPDSSAPGSVEFPRKNPSSPDVANGPPTPTTANGNGNAHNGRGHSRDTSFSRRPSRLSMSSYGPRKTSVLCMFFPSGKCKNG